MTPEEQRKLLELAAKAAGIELKYDTFGQSTEADREYNYWNPLTDDGDALRLAVKLGLLISQSSYIPGENAYGFVNIAWYGQKVEFKPERFTDDPYAATRLAIVRAAAEIGRSMELPHFTTPQNLLSNGLTLLQVNPDCAAQLDPMDRDYGWLYTKGADGQWVTLRKLKGKELETAHDQAESMSVTHGTKVMEG